MSSNESAAYKIMRSLDVDYVLIIFGGVIGYSGDDINKFLWMVRIAEGEHPKDIRVSVRQETSPDKSRLTQFRLFLVCTCFYLKITFLFFMRYIHLKKTKNSFCSRCLSSLHTADSPPLTFTFSVVSYCCFLCKTENLNREDNLPVKLM